MKRFINWILSFFKRKDQTIITMSMHGYSKGDMIVVTGLNGPKSYAVNKRIDNNKFTIKSI